MKKIFLPLAVTLFAAGTIFIGCESSAQKVDNAEQNVADAQAKLDQARLDSADEYNKAKAVWEAQIASNEKELADYKVQIAKEKKDAQTKDEARLDELEAKNAALKVQMTEYNQNGMTKWDDFKMSFNKSVSDLDEDMHEFGNKVDAMSDKK